MRIITLNFTKVSAEKSKGFKLGGGANTNISFLDIEREEGGIIKEDSDVLRVSFNFSVEHKGAEKNEKKDKSGEVSLTGFVILMTTKEESKLLLDSWKKKELPPTFQVPMFNYILLKCSVRALQIEEELGLPLHIPLPQLKAGPKEEKKDEKDDKKE